jgi:restriction system protein
VLGAIGVAVGLGILVWRRLTGGVGARWATEILGIRSVDDIYALSPAQFEEFTAFLFQQRGFDVSVVGHSGDEGIDIELHPHHTPQGTRMVAQCKRYRGSVGQPIVREFYGSFANQATEGYLVTTGTFTQPAREWAASRPLHLIDGTELLRWTEQVAQGMHHHHVSAPQSV